MLLRHSVMNCINHLEGERECYEIESSSDWIPVRGIVISASLGGTCNMMIDMKIAMLTKPSQFCLHGIVYESKYCKSCIGGTCNRRIDMTECNIPSPFVIVLTLWSLPLGPGAVPTDTTLSNNIELAWSENSTVLGDLGKVQAKNTKAKREQGGESRQYCGLRSVWLVTEIPPRACLVWDRGTRIRVRLFVQRRLGCVWDGCSTAKGAFWLRLLGGSKKDTRGVFGSAIITAGVGLGLTPRGVCLFVWLSKSRDSRGAVGVGLQQ
ncbi:hypothetical protein Tco_0413469 [Tanacetum coccineum]